MPLVNIGSGYSSIFINNFQYFKRFCINFAQLHTKFDVCVKFDVFCLVKSIYMKIAAHEISTNFALHYLAFYQLNFNEIYRYWSKHVALSVSQFACFSFTYTKYRAKVPELFDHTLYIGKFLLHRVYVKCDISFLFITGMWW